MGNASYRQTTLASNQSQISQQDLANFMQVDLPKFVNKGMIGKGKFMKSYIMRVDSTQLMVKVYMKLPDEDLQQAIAQLTQLYRTIPSSKYPNLMPYQMWIRSSSTRARTNVSPVYLIRQFFHSNIYDRLSTRPFLNELEKNWIIFQLFKCLEICHELGIVHGDIKPENVMCTTFNWVVLTDFAPFKPVLIPDNDTTDFQYYFDCMGRHRCYLAPERFFKQGVSNNTTISYKGSSNSPNEPLKLANPNTANKNLRTADYSNNINYIPGRPYLTPAMDVFSLGCLIAEIHLDGTALLDLPAMLQYLSSSSDGLGTTSLNAMSGVNATNIVSSNQTNDAAVAENSNSTVNNPADDHQARSLLARINNHLLRNVIVDMTQKDPEKRLSISEYLDILLGRKPFTSNHSQAATPTSTSNQTEENNNQTAEEAPRVFPAYFDSCIYPLYLKLHWNGSTPDDRVTIICERYAEIVRSVTGQTDEIGSRVFEGYVQDSAKYLLHSRVTLSSRAPILQGMPTQVSIDGNNLTNAATSSVNSSGSAASALNSSNNAASTSNNNPSNIYNIFDNEELLDRAMFRHLLKHNKYNDNSNFNNSRSFNKLSEELHSFEEDRSSCNNCNIQELLHKARQQIALLEALDNAQDASMHANSSEVIEDDADDHSEILEDKNYSHTLRAFENISFVQNYDQQHSFFAPFIAGSNGERPVFEGLVLIVDILCSNYRHLQYQRSRTISLLLLARLGAMCASSVILRRIIPMVLTSFEDSSLSVKILAVKVLTSLVSKVDCFEPTEVNFFPQYLFPQLTRVVRDPELGVRLAFAECIGTLAITAKAFLDKGHQIFKNSLSANTNNVAGNGNANNSGSLSSMSDFSYDRKLELLKEQVERWVRDLIIDSSNPLNNNGAILPNDYNKSRAQVSLDSSVKKMLLHSMLQLCVFFGQESTMDKMLTQALTFLMDQDWELRALFCKKIPAVSAFLGPTVTSEYIIPCMENILFDMEEKVVLAALLSLVQLVQLSLLSRPIVIELVSKVRALVVHATTAIRDAALDFLIVAASSFASSVDTMVYILAPLQQAEILKFRVSLPADNSGQLKKSTLAIALEEKLSKDALRNALLQKLDEHTFSSSNSASGKQIAATANAAESLDEMELDGAGESGTATKEQKLLRFIDEYVTHAAREIFNKSLKWRSLVTGGNNRETLNALISSGNGNSSGNSNVDISNAVRTLSKSYIQRKHISWKSGNNLRPVSTTIASAAAAMLNPSGKFMSGKPAATSASASSASNAANGTALVQVLDSLVDWTSLITHHYIEQIHCISVPSVYHRFNSYSNFNSNSSSGNNSTTAMNSAASNANNMNNLNNTFVNFPLSDDLRKQSFFLTQDEQRNKQQIKALYFGAYANNYYSTITYTATSSAAPGNSAGANNYYAEDEMSHLLVGYNDAVNNATYNSSSSRVTSMHASAAVNVNNTPARRYLVNKNYSDEMDSISLLRKIKALKIPPLPTDLGALFNYSANGDLILSDSAQDDPIYTLTAVNNTAMLAAAGGANAALAGVNNQSGVGNASAANSSAGGPVGGGSSGSHAGVNSGGNAAGNSKLCQGILLMTLREHSAAVNKLVVAADQCYFASASDDHTVRIWQTRHLDKHAFPKSVASYRGHQAEVVDAVGIENSHSIATASHDGQVHVWRVELVPTSSSGGGGGASNTTGVAISSAHSSSFDNNTINYYNYTNLNAENAGNSNSATASTDLYNKVSVTARFQGAALVRAVDVSSEGRVLSVHHYNNDISSVVTFATQRGGVYGWDLRCPKLAWKFNLRGELGYSTAMTIAPDKHWVCVGTSRGALCLWDIRYSVLSQIYQHSSAAPIHKLACLKTAGKNGSPSNIPGLAPTEGAYLFVAAGGASNEAAVFGLPEAGECFKCFRSLHLNDSKQSLSPLPSLLSAGSPSHPLKPITLPLQEPGHSFLQYQNNVVGQYSNSSKLSLPQSNNHAVRAMIGRIALNNSASYLITAGSDRYIRYWDFRAPEACYTVCGAEPTQSKSMYVAAKLPNAESNSNSKLFICYTPALPSQDKVLQSQLPIREQRGLTAPSVNFKDGILDLKDLDVPSHLLLSSSRDGEIKIWK